MALVNYYKCIDSDKSNYRQGPKNTIQHPARVLLVGQSGSGKTSLMMNLLLNKSMKMKFDRIYVFAKNIVADPLYQLLIEHCESIQEELLEKTGEEHQILFSSDDLSELPDLTELDPDLQTCVIVDDFLGAKGESMDKVKAWFIASRKYNVSIFFLAQRLTPIDRTIRQNVNYVCAFATQSNAEMNLYAKEFSPEMDLKDFKDLFISITWRKTKPDQVKPSILIDMCNTDPNMRYRRNIIEPVLPAVELALYRHDKE